MILNSGLDHACTFDSASATNVPHFCKFVQFAAFGTGSSVPAENQTTLDAQVGNRSIQNGGFDSIENAGVDDGTDTIWFEATYTRVFSIASNVNAAEWGLAPTSTGNLSVRDLFRANPTDNSSSPITLTLEEGDQLQLVVTFRVQATWEYESKSFVITGAPGNDSAGTHVGDATVAVGSTATLDSFRGAVSAVWPGGAINPTTARVYVYTSDQSTVSKSTDLTGSAAAFQGTVAESYTPGSFSRDYTVTFTTSEANGNHYAWVAGAVSRGYRFILTDPPYLTKQNTHRLTLTVRKSISRL